jgi:hypothetical protein
VALEDGGEGHMNPVFSRAAQVVFWDPILKRELVAGLRSVRVRWILLLFLVAPFVAVLTEWPDGAMYYGGSQLARGVWDAFFGVQIALVVLLTPIFSAYSISTEYEQDTVDFLWTTAVAPWRVVLSKMLAIFLLVSALILTSAPGLSMVFFLGGVGSDEITDGYSLLLGLAASITALGTFYSAFERKGHRSLLLTYLTMIGSVPLMGIFVGLSRGSLHTIVVFLFFYAFVFGWLACLMGSRPVGETTRDNFRPIDDPRIIEMRRNMWPYYLVDPLRRNPPIEDEDNVVAAHEDQAHPLLRTVWSYRILLYPQLIVCIPACLGLVMNAREFDNHIVTPIWWCNLVGMVPWIVLVHAISMTMEQESRTFDALRLTIITPMEWLKGKWQMSVQKRWPMILFAVGTIGLVHLMAGCPPGMLVWMVVSWVLCIEAAGIITFAVASFCTRTVFAIAISIVAAIAVPFSMFILADSLREIPEISPFHGGMSSRKWSEAQMFFLATLAWILAGCLAWLIAVANVQRRWKNEVKPS